METYKEITVSHLLSLIADKDTSNVFYRANGNLYPTNRVEFSFSELHTIKFYLKQLEEKQIILKSEEK